MAQKNLIWLVFDSIRGDRTSIGGYDRETTPTLDRIGSQPDGTAGTCFAHGIWSQPSVASMMTGVPLSTHGAGDHNERLPREIPTVAERLSAAGYRTVGVSSNPYFSATTGTDCGFDEFDFVSGGELAREAGLPSLAAFVRHLRTYSGGLTLDKQKHTPDFLLNQIVTERLESCAEDGSPFFLAAHYYGAHHPYYPAPAFRDEFASELELSAKAASELAFEQSKNVYEQIAGGYLDSAADRAAVDAMYDAQVCQVDALIDRLLTTISRLNLDEDTILVITSDHGDLLGEHDLFSHKLLLHDALIEVPIAIRGSEYLANKELGLSQHTDIMRTILTELDIDTDGMGGMNLHETEPEMAVAQRGAETYEKTVTEVQKHDPDFDHEHAFSGLVTALRTNEWKYVAGEHESALYSIPGEGEDVSAANPEVVSEFEERLEAWYAEQDAVIDDNERAEFDDDIKDHLADLGYVVE